MIHFIKITNFGAIRDEVELNFEATDEAGAPDYVVQMPDNRRLLKLAFIYGANASGKSTVLRAIGFLRRLWLQPTRLKEDSLDFDPFLFRPDAWQFRSQMEVAFYINSTRCIYTVSFNQSAIIEERLVAYYSHQPTELYSRQTDLVKRVSQVEFGKAVKAEKAELNALASATLLNNTVVGAYQKTNVFIPLMAELTAWANQFLPFVIESSNMLAEFTGRAIRMNPELAAWMDLWINRADRHIRGLEVKPEKRQLNDYLVQKMLQDENIDDRTFSDLLVKDQIRFLHAMPNNDVYALPLEKESAGSVRHLELGYVLYNLIKTPSFAVIDELDTSLHADLLKFYLQSFLLNSPKSQLLFTSHNLFLLEDQDLIRRDALWLTQKDEMGNVSLYSAADVDSSKLRKGGSLINAYSSGRLGAKPNLGSPYFNLP